MSVKLDRKKHVYQSTKFNEIIKDTIRFFNGTPVHVLPPPDKFSGTGVYGLYYTGNFDQYKEETSRNRISYSSPIYVGKAVPQGWRQSRQTSNQKTSSELFRRLTEHSKSIESSKNLTLDSFHCRFMILEDESIDLIGTIEAALIRQYLPIWNSTIDGFGNHDPGSGRYEQAKSDWDVLHPGRHWASKCKGKSNPIDHIIHNLNNHYLQQGPNE